MTAQKSNTGKSGKAEAETSNVPDFDLRRAYGSDHLFNYATVPVTAPDGERLEITVPFEEGTAPEEIRQQAISYAQRRRQAQRIMKSGAFDDDYFEQALKAVAWTAATIVIGNTMGVIRERFGNEALKEALGDRSPSDVYDSITETHAVSVLSVMRGAAAPREWILPVEEDLMASALEAFEGEHGGPMSEVFPDLSDEELGTLFAAAYEKYWTEYIDEAKHTLAQRVAQMYVEGIKPNELPLEQLAAMLQPAQASNDAVLVATGKISRVLQEGIIKRTDQEPLTRTVELTKQQSYQLRVDSRLDPKAHPALQAHPRRQEEILQDMQLTLAGWKEHNAALLKLHLDLSNQAHRHSLEQNTDQPVFRYDLAAALERQGYAFNSKRRGYDPRTMQNLRQRIEALYSHRVTAWSETRTGGRKESFATPYWLVEGFGYDPKQLDLGLVPALAANSGSSAAYRSVLIRPGLWWKFAEMSDRRYPIPASILRLPTDGRGREQERYALLISTFLALHVRRNQRQHAGKAVILKTGTLLEEAGITTWEEFDQMHPTQASRMRDHLHHSSEETGVFPLLRELEAFDIQVADQRAFYASGRGWKSKFWDSRLEIAVPDLEIVKRKK